MKKSLMVSAVVLVIALLASSVFAGITIRDTSSGKEVTASTIWDALKAFFGGGVTGAAVGGFFGANSFLAPAFAVTLDGAVDAGMPFAPGFPIARTFAADSGGANVLAFGYSAGPATVHVNHDAVADTEWVATFNGFSLAVEYDSDNDGTIDSVVPGFSCSGATPTDTAFGFVIEGRTYDFYCDITGFAGTAALEAVTSASEVDLSPLDNGYADGAEDVEIIWPGPVGGVCGDANGDSLVNAADPVYLLDFLFGGGPACVGDCDLNDDSFTDISDVIGLLSSVFAGGPAPTCTPATPNCTDLSDCPEVCVIDEPAVPKSDLELIGCGFLGGFELNNFRWDVEGDNNKKLHANFKFTGDEDLVTSFSGDFADVLQVGVSASCPNADLSAGFEMETDGAGSGSKTETPSTGDGQVIAGGCFIEDDFLSVFSCNIIIKDANQPFGETATPGNCDVDILISGFDLADVAQSGPFPTEEKPSGVQKKK